MPILVCRHGERMDYALKPTWTRTAPRSWDPPLTENGKRQAFLAGESMKKHLDHHGFPVISRIYCSPLIRCIDTALEIARAMGTLAPGCIRVETHLTETICESWYRSWAIRNESDSSWGGPANHRNGTPLETDLLKPEAFLDANQLFLTYGQLHELYGDVIDPDYPRHVLPAFHYDKYETESHTAYRIGGFAEAAQDKHSEETILLVSHGGPTGACYEYLMGLGEGSAPRCGYSAFFLYNKLGVSGARGSGAVGEAAQVAAATEDAPAPSDGESASAPAKATTVPTGSPHRNGTGDGATAPPSEDDSDAPATTTTNTVCSPNPTTELCEPKYKWDCLVEADIAHLGNVDQGLLGYAVTGRITETSEEETSTQ